MEDTAQIQDIEESANSLKRMGSALRIVFLALAAIIIVAGILIAVSSVSNGTSGDQSPNGAPQTFLAFFFMVLLASVLLLSSGMFSDIAKGMSPFSDKQVRRLRVISALFLIAFFADALIPLGSAAIGSGASLETRAVADEYLSFKVNPLILSCSIFFFALSFVFKYGSLLQSLSDDTV